MTDSNYPLKGVRVVELATHVAVPNATRFLADWGAEVIKVESLKGDEWRIVGRNQMCPITDEENPFYTLQNANKKFIAIDLKNLEGKEIMYKLIGSSEIFVTNVRLSPLKKLGMDYETIAQKFPEIIYGHFTGYGYNGSDAEKPGFDSVAFWARSGAMVDWVPKGSQPFLAPTGTGDAMAASILSAGLLAALVAKRTTGKGTFLTSSLLGGAVWYNGSAIVSAQYGNQFPIDHDRPLNPFGYQYQCRDGEWLMIAIMDYNGVYPIMCKLLNREDLIGDERFSTIIKVRAYMGLFLSIIKEAFLKKDRDEWVELLTAANIVCGKIGHMCNLYNDPQVTANDYVKPVTFKSGNTVVMPTVPMFFSEYSTMSCSPTGGIGRDTDEILREVGLDENEIAELCKRGVIKS